MNDEQKPYTVTTTADHLERWRAKADKFEKLAHAEAMELVRLAAENDDLREALEIKAKDAKFLFITEQKATADRRLRLLEEMLEFVWDDTMFGYFCQICYANKRDGHADDCELARELADGKS